jgi:diacylglycerol kinase
MRTQERANFCDGRSLYTCAYGLLHLDAHLNFIIATMTSSRLSLLNQAIEKALIEARKSFSKTESIHACYGDDASIFGGNAVLEQVVDGMLDEIHRKVKGDMQTNLQKHDIEAKLVSIEALVDKFQREQDAAQDKEAKDKATALGALHQVKLPPGLTAEMIVSYRAHAILKDEKERLELELSKVLKETKDLEALYCQAEATVESRVRVVERGSRELERTADLCSIVS